MLPLRVRQEGSGQAGSRWAAGPILVEGEWRMQKVLMEHPCFRFMTKVGKGVCWGQGCKRVTQLSHGMEAGAMFQDGKKREEERAWGNEEKLACLPYCPPDSSSLRGSVQGWGTCT